ncbi:hypothetical protein [Roseibium alexandrii]|uniref:Uncharacterized protein n=1 Tax=Roseibium alexandrii TaxID=388408 RepID=A0A0M7ASD6_9HYPH|nr:hypothetical protein [Roseibium alexandrii]CTQ77567.1 hypothetical protein LAX5112_04955 [Roseibium alexandrii]
MTATRWEVEQLADGITMVISSLGPIDHMVEMSIVETQNGTFTYEALKGRETLSEGVAPTLPAAIRAAENAARRALFRIV